jgi:hypothetical protein
VAHETVSRALTALQHVGGIVVTYRDIEIVDAKLLQEIQRVTRGTWKGALRQGGLSGAISPVVPGVIPGAMTGRLAGAATGSRLHA